MGHEIDSPLPSSNPPPPHLEHGSVAVADAGRETSLPCSPPSLSSFACFLSLQDPVRPVATRQQPRAKPRGGTLPSVREQNQVGERGRRGGTAVANKPRTCLITVGIHMQVQGAGFEAVSHMRIQGRCHGPHAATRGYSQNSGSPRQGNKSLCHFWLRRLGYDAS